MKRRHFLQLGPAAALASEKPQANVLGQDYTIVARNNPDDLVGSPGLARLPDGSLIATYENWQNSQKKWDKVSKVLRSTDGGLTWQRQGASNLAWPSPFVANGALYMIGNIGGTWDIAISRSDDKGAHWTLESVLFRGRYTNAPTTVLHKGGFVYRAFESTEKHPWASLVVAGDTARDLLDPAAWRMSNHVPYPGTPPALTQGKFPPSPKTHTPEDGWLEGNVVEVRGQLRIMLRVRMQSMSTAGICAICDVDDTGGKLTSRFAQFAAMPGGQGKFQIIYDTTSRLYWTAVTPVTDPFQPPEPMWKRGFFGGPGNERRILTLMFSLDALSWFQAGFVALSSNPLESFSYAALLAHGDDMLVLARSSVGAQHQHDTNLITLHRVKGFRGLVPKKFYPDA